MGSPEAGEYLWHAGLAFGATVILTGGVRRYALQISLLDIPTERSSHGAPTPRGAGLAIAVVILAALLSLIASDRLSGSVAIAFAGGGAMVAGIGWLDDRSSVTPLWRVCVHLAAAAWALCWLGGFPSVKLGTAVLHLGWLGTLMAGLGLVWLINLYNFMDGSDGLAGIQGVCTGAMGSMLMAMDKQYGLSILSLVLAAACGGFLAWNWPPAKIFMGDVGSGLLGYLFGLVALVGESAGGSPALLWLILLAVFIADATYTLIGRVVAGETWYAPHRSHAYQGLVQLGLSHGQVALGACALNLLLLWPLTYAAHQHGEWSLAAASLVYMLLWILWNRIQHLRKLDDR